MSASPACTPKPPLRRVLLERVPRPLLARFLSTHLPGLCAAHSFPIADLAASDPRDRALVHRLFDLLTSDPVPPPGIPEPALAWLATLDALATSRGGEQLIALDQTRALPRGRLGDEELALTAVLDHPALALQAHALLPSEAADGISGYTEYDPATPWTLRFGDAERKALEALCGVELEARDRTSHCVVYVTREPKRLLLEIEYCRRPKTRDKLDVEALVVTPATDVNAERAFAEIDRETGRLALHASHPGTKEMLRKALGKVLTSDAQHFTAARVYDLSPFRDLEAALVPHGERLLGVALHMLTVRTLAETEVAVSRARRDVRDDATVASLVVDITKLGAPVAVKLYLRILNRRLPLKVELSAKQGRNRLHFDRSDPEIVALVRGYLIARGILRELAPPPRTSMIVPAEPASSAPAAAIA